MLIWHEKYETGHATIDTQHKMLVTYINRLEGLLKTTNPTRQECEFIVAMVEFLEAYVDSHFQFEEQCMDRYRCPAHGKNKQAHQDFIVFFKHFKERYAAEGFRQDILSELHKNVHDWILGHILQIDTQLRDCVPKTPPPAA